MKPSHGKVVLGVSGSIAAFKAAQLASDLVKQDLALRVIMTAGAARFVSALTFEGLSGHAVAMDIWDEQPGSSRIGHLELARWAEVMVVAPATAGVLARLALGLTDDMLGAAALATGAPLILAPSMESRMWAHPATQGHVEVLRNRGAQVVGPNSGRLASGARGEGRMAEPDEILRAVLAVLARRRDMQGRSVLVTAGPTHEPLDPVRYLGNRSSGKMGYALAEEARDRGASVTLVSGPTALPPPPGVSIVRVETAAEMLEAARASARDVDVVVMAAAVADFAPAAAADHKIKRHQALSLALEPTPDIAAALSSAVPGALHVGFALETDNLVEAARDKRRRKGQHMVVANSISADHNPFGSSTNRVALITEDRVIELPELSKREVARRVFDMVRDMLHQRGSAC